ncbi:MAG: hypothetical protein ACIAQZ_05270 [Sedimentisphaeraceae bacterium JB056]
MKLTSIMILLAILVITQLGFSAERVDFWAEELAMFGSAPQGQLITSKLGGNIIDKKANKAIAIDTTDKRNGDFSMCFNAFMAAGHNQVGFYCGKYQDNWPINNSWSLHLFLKAEMKKTEFNPFLVLIDSTGRKARLILNDFAADGKWHELTVAFRDFIGERGFDSSKIKMIVLQDEFTKDVKVWFDDVYFVSSAGEILGVTDKSIEQRMSEAEANRQKRIQEAYEYGAVKGVKMWYVQFFAQLYLGENLDSINKELLEVLSSEEPEVRRAYGHDNFWDLAVNNTLIKIYYAFGDKGIVFPGRLYPKTQNALLELLWYRTADKNDIAVARQSTWWMAGSENHDLSFKMSCYLTSQIFKNEPEFANRIYPDAGHGAGSGYWFHRIDGKAFHGYDARADLADGKEYNAQDHYNEWVRFFIEYFSERAKRGFFLETHSPTYMKYTGSFIFSIYNFSEDKILKQQAHKFLDLMMANWAQDQFNGARGGAKTRVKASHYATNGTSDSFYALSEFLLGGDGKGMASAAFSFVPLSDYRLPKAIWKMALDRESLGCFAYISRKPGEEENVWPRPLGLERSLMCDTHSRLLRYSWITPDYIMGTQMDHPGAVHSHLSCQARWEGISFSTNPNIKIFPRGIEEQPGGKWKMTTRFYRSVQDKRVLITQQNRSWFVMHPDWFPGKSMDSEPFGVHIGKGHDKLIEKDGWIFIQQGNAYVAIRVILDKKVDLQNEQDVEWYKKTEALVAELDDDSYHWNKDHTIIMFTDRFSPVIFETARKADYPTLEDFQADILDNPIKLQNTVVPEWYTLTYTGCGDGAKEIYFNAANSEIPMVGGERIDYSYPMTFDSPYLKSKYNSGKVFINCGDDSLELDFNCKP